MTVFCETCKGAITPTVPGIKCNICTLYYHIKCVGITKNQFDVCKAMTGFTWKCEKCNINSNSKGESCNCCILLPGLLDTLKKLTETVETLKQQITLLSSNNSKTPDNSYEFEAVVQEVSEREKRKNKIIFYGISEQDSSLDSKNRREKDSEFLSDFLQFVNANPNDYMTPESQILLPSRLGKFEANPNKSRPIKITLNDNQQVRNLLSLIKKNRANIEGNPRFKSIRVSLDRTSRQRHYYNELKDQIKQRLENGEENLFIKYVRGIPTIQKSLN